MGPPFNLTYLHEAFQGNETLVNSIIDLFIKQSPTYCVTLKEKVEAGEFDSLHTTAHTLKSSVQMLGLTSTSDLVNEIEKRSKYLVDTEELPDMVNLLIIELERAHKALTEYMNAGKSDTSFHSNVA